MDKHIRKLIWKQRRTSFRVAILTLAVVTLAIKFDQMSRELEELKREKGV